MRDPYEVLGMSRNSDPDALRARYEELKAKYGEQRFEDGERGNEGARLLSELESSWALVSRDIESRGSGSDGGKSVGGGYPAVENYIRSGDYDAAQRELDDIQDRDGKWHYYQSIIFYKREWLSESRAQLVIAVQMEPDNEKYKESLRKLDLVMGNAHADPNSMGRGQQGPYDQGYDQSYRQQYTEDNSQAQQAGNVCANCVCAYCMTELCCAMMRGCH